MLFVLSLFCISFSVSLSAVSLSSSESSCYVSPACTATEFYDRLTGFTNDTGWALPSDLSLSSSLSLDSLSSFSSFSSFSSSSSSECCQICLPNTPATVCFDSKDLNCLSKTGDGDYDFLLLDQIWQPQFCSSLQHGYDPTLTHMIGTVCSNDAPRDLRIHGLWPNYYNGYPQCCNNTQDVTYTLNPAEVIEWEIFPSIQSHWAGTVPLETCSVCSMMNHEWWKLIPHSSSSMKSHCMTPVH